MILRKNYRFQIKWGAYVYLISAWGETRTLKALRPVDFESTAYSNSATQAIKDVFYIEYTLFSIQNSSLNILLNVVILI